MREFRYVVNGETPSKKNGQTFNRHSKIMFKSKRFRVWHEDAMKQILSQGIPDKPLDHMKASFKFYHGDLINRDSDNQMTSILDLLQDTNVISNDSWKNIPRKVVEDYLDRGNARVEIFLQEVDNPLA